jgi:NADH:ubiquinone oxidoreductase subunit E
MAKTPQTPLSGSGPEGPVPDTGEERQGALGPEERPDTSSQRSRDPGSAGIRPGVSGSERDDVWEMRPTDDLTAAERQELIAGMRPEDAQRVPELHEVDMPPELQERIERAMGRYPQIRSAAIPALWAVQRHHGWCSPEGIRQAAAVMGVTPGYLEGVASFYDLFHTNPEGRHRVLVCHNISCWMNGGDALLEAFGEATGADAGEAEHGGASSPDGEFYLQGFECLGACDMAPMASIDEIYFGPLDLADAATAVEQMRAGEKVLEDKALGKRPAAAGPEPDPDPRVAKVENGRPAAGEEQEAGRGA